MAPRSRTAAGLRVAVLFAAFASVAAQSKGMLLLTYTYGPDILTTRTPYRAAHLANAVSYINQGLLVVGGATPDTYPTIGQPYSAYWIFSNYATTATVQAFMANDSYVNNSLVKFFRISNYSVPNVNSATAGTLVNSGIDTAYNTQPTLNVSVASPAKTFIALFYTYGSDIFTTRTPYRPAHLINCATYVNASLMVIGGAFPPTDAQPYGAMFVFNQNANATVISQFIANDPYVTNNLVVSYFTRNWAVPLISPSADAAAPLIASPSPPPPTPPPPIPPPPVVVCSASAAAQPILMLAALAGAILLL